MSDEPVPEPDKSTAEMKSAVLAQKAEAADSVAASAHTDADAAAALLPSNETADEAPVDDEPVREGAVDEQPLEPNPEPEAA
jgi:hypothetical protein